MRKFQELVQEEVKKAKKKHPSFNSFHEGYAVILEEFDELLKEIRKKPSERDMVNLRLELIQVAAMCQRFDEDLLCKKK